MILDEQFSNSWQNYLNQYNCDGVEEVTVFKRRIFRQRRNHFFPPPIIKESFILELADASKTLLRLIASIPQRVFNNDIQRLLDFQGVKGADAEILLTLCTPKFLKLATYFSRPDFIITREGAKISEVNISAPIGGMMTCDPFFEEFRKMKYYEYLVSQGASLNAPNTSQIWNQALLDVCPVAKATEAPILFEAIANPNDIDSGRQNFVTMAKKGGFTVVSGQIQQLSVLADGVYLDNQRIHTVFTMFTWSELRKYVPFELILKLAESDEAGLVDFIAPPVNALFDHKANLEILTSDLFSSYFSEDERSFIKRYVPRTYRVTKENIKESIQNKDSLVLKPASEYGGRDITFGSQVSPSAWAQAITNAAQTPHLFICQEKILDLWTRPVGDGEKTLQYFMCLGPMIFGDNYAGVYVRQSVDRGVTPVINVGHGAEDGTAFINLQPKK